jgi:sugar phosphate isomerase/epimerase
VSAENHVWSSNPDDDIFLLRTENDFHKLIEVTNGGILVKFDPAWLLKPGVGQQPVPAFERLLPHIGVLDLKDAAFPDGKIATGRKLEWTPACIYGRNSHSLCVENFGNFDIG